MSNAVNYWGISSGYYKEVIFKDRTSGITIMCNGSIHNCNVCIHRSYCDKKTAKTLMKNAHLHNNMDMDRMRIYIPYNCPIYGNLRGKGKVKVPLY